jgi:hypothetical protein
MLEGGVVQKRPDHGGCIFALLRAEHERWVAEPCPKREENAGAGHKSHRRETSYGADTRRVTQNGLENRLQLTPRASPEIRSRILGVVVQ